jgi:thiamine biosynthesis lipoprotein
LARPAQVNSQSPARMPHDKGNALPGEMERREFRAMGSSIELFLPREQADQGYSAVCQLFAEWEQTLSRFRADSELSQLNQAAGKPVRVSQLLLNVLQTALIAAEATEGLFDPTLLNQLVRMGYDRSFDALPLHLPDSIASAAPGGGWRKIKVDAGQQSVTLPEGVGLDFGGIAKGMAVDAAVELLNRLGIRPALVNAGGDLAVLGLPLYAEHWSIGIEGKEVSWSMPLRRGALTTSGIGYRHWQQGALRRHHIIDPRLGESVQSNLWSVTVAAERCEQAEVAAKVAFLLGPENGRAFLHRYGLSGLFLLEDGSKIVAGSWPVELMKTIEEK